MYAAQRFVNDPNQAGPYGFQNDERKGIISEFSKVNPDQKRIR
jgi:hypothetical protein